MEKQLRFFREYCRNVKEIGSVVPDSKVCVDVLLRQVPFATAKVIVEFGAASGAVTREIIRRKRRDTILVSFEKNRRLHASLKASLKGENVILVNEDAFNCAKVLAGIPGVRGKKADCIVSTLPCSCLDFDRLVREAVLPSLGEDGCFIQYMHTLSLLKGFNLKHSLRKFFPRLAEDLVLRNIPPALVYACHRQ
jgi:phospholipid N-methyltransferase